MTKQRSGQALIIVGIWVAVSPWVLGFASISSALWSNLITGMLSLVAGLWVTFGDAGDTRVE
jgi:hypothetical protein